MLFDFLKSKTNKNEPNNEILARISYIITKNSDSTIVDVELSEYNDECVESLCDIIEVLSQDKSVSDTVEIIKNALIQDGQSNFLAKFFSYLDLNTKLKLMNSRKNTIDEPCIKPSEVFLK